MKCSSGRSGVATVPTVKPRARSESGAGSRGSHGRHEHEPQNPIDPDPSERPLEKGGSHLERIRDRVAGPSGWRPHLAARACSKPSGPFPGALAHKYMAKLVDALHCQTTPAIDTSEERDQSAVQ